MDCIIMVGNRQDYRTITPENNKAFLEIGGRTILQIMMEELRSVDGIDRLVLVGPCQRLQAKVEEVFGTAYPKPILYVEQRQDLLENALTAVAETDNGDPQRYVLFLPSDIPLLTAEEVNEFIARADMNRYDLVTGLCTEETLSRFYPSDGKPGVVMEYFTLSCNRYRVNNMHMIRPAAVKHVVYIQRLYAMRYQMKFINGLKLLANLVKAGVGPLGLMWYSGLRVSSRLRVWGWIRMARFVERLVRKDVGERYICGILGARFHGVTTSFGGTSIDVDNEKDYQTVQQRHVEWLKMLKEATRFSV